MPTLYITEYTGIQADPSAMSMNCAVVPSITQQAIVYSSSSVQSATLNAATRLVRLVSDATCFKATGVNPTATQTATRMTAESAEYFAVAAGSNLKIAVIAAL